MTILFMILKSVLKIHLCLHSLFSCSLLEKQMSDEAALDLRTLINQDINY